MKFWKVFITFQNVLKTIEDNDFFFLIFNIFSMSVKRSFCRETKSWQLLLFFSYLDIFTQNDWWIQWIFFNHFLDFFVTLIFSKYLRRMFFFFYFFPNCLCCCCFHMCLQSDCRYKQVHKDKEKKEIKIKPRMHIDSHAVSFAVSFLLHKKNIVLSKVLFVCLLTFSMFRFVEIFILHI